jgi:hypothetical protein
MVYFHCFQAPPNSPLFFFATFRQAAPGGRWKISGQIPTSSSVKIPDRRFRNWHLLFATLPSRLILLLFPQSLLCGMMIALMTVKHTGGDGQPVE